MAQIEVKTQRVTQVVIGITIDDRDLLMKAKEFMRESFWDNLLRHAVVEMKISEMHFGQKRQTTTVMVHQYRLMLTVRDMLFQDRFEGNESDWIEMIERFAQRLTEHLGAKYFTAERSSSQVRFFKKTSQTEEK